MRPCRRPLPAMTAVEVLAATVLASLMLASVVGVLGGLARQERALRAKAPAPRWQRLLADQLLWDLRNSREMIVTPDGVRLTGFAGRDYVTGRPTGRPTELQYYLIAAAEDRWLVRREQHMDELTTGAIRTELVCRGVNSLQWGSAVVDRTAVNCLPAPQAKNESRIVVPERIAVALMSQDAGPPLLDEVILVR